MADEHDCKYEVIVTETHKMVKDMHKTWYEGNGKPPITVQIDRLNGFKKFSYWLYSVLLVATISFVVRLIYIVLTAEK